MIYYLFTDPGGSLTIVVGSPARHRWADHQEPQFWPHKAKPVVDEPGHQPRGAARQQRRSVLDHSSSNSAGECAKAGAHAGAPVGASGAQRYVDWDCPRSWGL